MSSPPGTPKQKRGIRRLLKSSFGRSRSHSPSQSLIQLDPGATSATIGFDEGDVQTASSTGAVSPSDSATNETHRAIASPSGPSEQAGGTSGIPTIVEPHDLAIRSGPNATQSDPGQNDIPRFDTMTTSTSSNLAPSDIPEPSNRTHGIAAIVGHVDTETGMAHLPSKDITITSEHNPASPFKSPGSDQKIRNVAWDILRGSLRFLRESPGVFPQLSSAVDSIISCLDGVEEVAQNHQDFEMLATELTTLSESLKQQLNGPSSVLVSNSTTNIAIAIEQQAMEIRGRLDRTQRLGIRGAIIDDNEITNANMSTWAIANEHLVNTRLEGLNPAKQATYDSSLSTQINRRGCTEGTRVGVLDGLENWLDNPLSSSIYWMSGMAGTGKTTVASTFCERVERRRLLAASFFCTRSSAECRNVARIVPTIAYQLARYSIPFQSALCQVLGQTPDIGSKNVLKQFEHLLKGPLQQVKDAVPDNLVIVIDALDECDDRNGVELVLDMLFRHASQVPLKILVTSRPEPEIYGKMLAHSQFREVLHLHEIEKSLVRADIELYLKEELDFMSPPASQGEISQLVERSGTLFIYAATLVRYIQSGKRLADPHKRLRSVLGLTSESTKQNTQIDALYRAVLKSVLSDDELEVDEIEDIRVVLRTVLFAQEPISVETIAELAEIDDSERVAHALHPLRSVLHQSEETGLVSTLHASFPDFMFSIERAGTYFFDVAEHSQMLASRCFLLMREQLRFNICYLASSFVPDKMVENIQERIKTNISPTLAYTCRYWASHLASAPRAGTLLECLNEFLCDRLLFWVEVLNLHQEIITGIDGLLKAQRWLRGETSISKLLILVEDAHSFVTGFAINPSSQSTPHLYLSTLPLCPQSNSVYKNYWKRTRGLLDLKGSLIERRETAPLATWAVGSEIESLALSPDGTRVAVGCLDATLSILLTYDGTIHVGPFQGHTAGITSIAFSPDGGLVVSGSIDRTLRVWDAYNGTLRAGPFWGHTGFIDSVSFSPDGTCIVSCSHDCTIRIWDTYTGSLLLGPLKDHTDLVLSVAFSPNGVLIASASADKTIRLWNTHNGTPAALPIKGHTGWVGSLVFTPDGSRLISSSTDQTIRVWSVPDGALLTDPFKGHTNSVNSLAVSPDGTRVASGGDNTVRVWKIDDGTLVAGPFFSGPVHSLAYSPDGTRVVSGSSDKRVRVWNVRDGILPPPPLLPQDTIMGVKCAVFHPDGAHFLSSSGQGVLRIWDATDGSFITSPNKASLVPTIFSTLSPDGSCIASTSSNGNIQIVDMTDGSLVAGPFGIERDSLTTFAFSRNNRGILMGSEGGTIKIYDMKDESTTIGSFTAHHKRVSSLSESPDCSLLVSHSDYEMAFRVWDIVTPVLDLKSSSTPSGSNSVRGSVYAAVHDGWHIREDGWAVDKNQHLLFWLPADIASAWCSPYAKLAITDSGILQVPKQNLFVGDEWTRCYLL